MFIVSIFYSTLISFLLNSHSKIKVYTLAFLSMYGRFIYYFFQVDEIVIAMSLFNNSYKYFLLRNGIERTNCIDQTLW